MIDNIPSGRMGLRLGLIIDLMAFVPGVVGVTLGVDVAEPLLLGPMYGVIMPFEEVLFAVLGGATRF